MTEQELELNTHPNNKSKHIVNLRHEWLKQREIVLGKSVSDAYPGKTKAFKCISCDMYTRMNVSICLHQQKHRYSQLQALCARSMRFPVSCKVFRLMKSVFVYIYRCVFDVMWCNLKFTLIDIERCFHAQKFRNFSLFASNNDLNEYTSSISINLRCVEVAFTQNLFGENCR